MADVEKPDYVVVEVRYGSRRRSAKIARRLYLANKRGALRTVADEIDKVLA